MRTFIPFISLIMIISLFIGCSSGIEPDDSFSSDIPLSTSSTVTDSNGNRYETGFVQVSENQQNPFVQKYNPNDELLWEMEHDNSSIDVRGILVTVDPENRPWVVFTLDGGSSSSSYIATKSASENAFSGVFQSSYGQGGGPEVSVITRLNSENGIIERGTFLTAKLENGNTNSLIVQGIGVGDGVVRVQSESAFRPPFTGTTYSEHPEANEYGPCGVFLSQIDLSITLDEIVESDLLTIQEASELHHTVWNQDCSLKSE